MTTPSRELAQRRLLELGAYREWLPIVERLRPYTPWPAVAAEVSKALPGERWTGRTLSCAVRRLVITKAADASLLRRHR